MKLFLPTIKQPNIIIFDIEYDQHALVQLALLHFSLQTQSNPEGVFELTKRLNLYVKQGQLLSDFFKSYTNITDDFLCDNGVDLSVARTLVHEIIPDNSIIVSHGLKCDLEILKSNGFDWSNYQQFCTYEAAKKILHRTNNISLRDIAALDGYYMFDEHNAYADVWGTLHALCYLTKETTK